MATDDGDEDLVVFGEDADRPVPSVSPTKVNGAGNRLNLSRASHRRGSEGEDEEFATTPRTREALDALKQRRAAKRPNRASTLRWSTAGSLNSLGQSRRSAVSPSESKQKVKRRKETDEQQQQQQRHTDSGKSDATASVVQVQNGDRRVGRLALLQWLNGILRADYTRIQECSDGIAYCQLIDIAFPGKVPLSKLEFNPRSKADKERNMAVFQRSLLKLGIDRSIDASSIASGNFSDNNELLRWLYTFVQLNAPADPPYDPLKRRADAQERRRRSLPSSRPSSSAASLPGNLYPNDLSCAFSHHRPSSPPSPGAQPRCATGSPTSPPGQRESEGTILQREREGADAQEPGSSRGNHRAELERLCRWLEADLQGRLQGVVEERRQVASLRWECEELENSLRRAFLVGNEGSGPLARSTCSLLQRFSSSSAR